MKTEHRLAEALKNLMSETSLDDISVTTLTKKCHINRQSFYYHFHDIYDLLMLVYLDEKIEDLEEVKDTNGLMECLFKYYVSNKNFVENTVNSAAKDLLQEFIYNATYQTLLRFVNEKTTKSKLKPNDKKSIARFYSLSLSYSFVYFLVTSKQKTLNQLKNTYKFLSPNYLEKAIKNLEGTIKHD